MEGIVDRKCKRTCDTFVLFDRKLTADKLIGLTLLNESLPYSDVDEIIDDIGSNHKHAASTVNYYCPLCDIKFIDDRQMRDHYKTDWHLYNLNLRRQARSSISEDDFGNLTLSSSSDDDEEDYEEIGDNKDDTDVLDIETELEEIPDDDFQSDSSVPLSPGPPSDPTSPGPPDLQRLVSYSSQVESFDEASRRHRIFFRNKNREIVGLHRCLLYTKHCRPSGIHELLRRVDHLRISTKWAIFLYSGGCFAGGIFDERSEVVHKTFKRYTVRKKQGGGQTAQDSKGNAPKSAGASLRRYCERAIRKDIHDLLHTTWRTELASCHLLLYWTPKSQKSVLIPSSSSQPNGCHSSSGKEVAPVFTASDPRLRSIPLIVRDITYSQVKLLHTQLSTYDVYDSHADVSFLKQTPRRQLASLSSNGSGILQETHTGRLVISPGVNIPKDEKTKKIIKVEFDDMDSPVEQSKKKRKKKLQLQVEKEAEDVTVKEPSDSISPSIWNPQDTSWRDRLFVAVACGDVVTCKELLQSKKQETQTEKEDFPTDLLNDRVGGGFTFLHVAASGTDPHVIRLLLEWGADPAVKALDGSTPYQKASKAGSKAMTSVFRLFMNDFPDRYDYTAAQIPSPLDPAKEAEKKAKEAERRRAQAKAKREREKVKKAEERVTQEEIAEKNRFLNLSDREKRALASERRLLEQAKHDNRTIPVFNRCYQCGADISGKVPFEYDQFRFCTTQCLRLHRTANAIPRSKHL